MFPQVSHLNFGLGENDFLFFIALRASLAESFEMINGPLNSFTAPLIDSFSDILMTLNIL